MITHRIKKRNRAYFAYKGLMISTLINKHTKRKGDRGGTVVKVLCYKSEGRWFDSRWCHWNFSLT